MSKSIVYGTDPVKVLREQREKVCFPIINRGKLWYDCLTPMQLGELKQWYWEWLDVTETLTVPIAPSWLNDKLISEEVIL